MRSPLLILALLLSPLHGFSQFQSPRTSPDPQSGPVGYWSPHFVDPMFTGNVEFVAQDRVGMLFLAGTVEPPCEPGMRFARFDGNRWIDLSHPIFDRRMTERTFTDQFGNIYVHTVSSNGATVIRWDGQSWHPLAPELTAANPLQHAAVDSNGDVFLGGYWQSSQGRHPLDLWRWNGEAWAIFRAPSAILSLAVGADDSVYAIEDIAGAPGQRLIRYFDGRWDTISENLEGVRDNRLSVSKTGRVFFVGARRIAGVSEAGIFRVDPDSLAFVTQVEDMEELYLYGEQELIATQRTDTTRELVRWDGSQLVHLASIRAGAGFPFLSVSSLYVDDLGRTLVGGSFYSVNGIPTGSFAILEDGTWSSFTCESHGVAGQVNAFAGDGIGELYVGGGIERAGLTQVNNVARWDGALWRAVGEGLNGTVLALATLPDGSILAGGHFSRSGQVEVNNVALWNGREWEPLGDGIDGTVTALAADDAGNIYAGGHRGESQLFVYWWDGTMWRFIGGDLAVPSSMWARGVHALAIGIDGSLYAGGRFPVAEPDVAVAMARWDGHSWQAIASVAGPTFNVANPVISALAVSGNSIYVGGDFSAIAGVPARNVARWDGTGWHSLDDGLDGPVWAMSAGNANAIYMAGSFNHAGDRWVGRVALWQHHEWNPLGSLEGSPAIAIFAVSGGDVFVGRAGTGIAKWVNSALPEIDPPQDPRPVVHDLQVHAAYPNPSRTRHTLTVRYDSEVDIWVDVEVFDVMGRRVLVLDYMHLHANRYFHTITFDVSQFSPGTYFVRFVGPGLNRASKLIVAP